MFRHGILLSFLCMLAVCGTIKKSSPVARKPSAAGDAGPVRSLLGGKPHRPLFFFTSLRLAVSSSASGQ